jgi:hypothetical protein
MSKTYNRNFKTAGKGGNQQGNKKKKVSPIINSPSSGNKLKKLKKEAELVCRTLHRVVLEIFMLVILILEFAVFIKWIIYGVDKY